MKRSIKLASALLLAFLATGLAGNSAAHARGGGPPQLNWPGYQQRLMESRGYVTNRSVSQPYTTPPAVYPGQKWKKRGKRK